MALTDGVVQSLLEAMPFMGWMKGGTLAKRVFRTAAQEGGEEVVQGLFENFLKVKGWKGTENLYNDMMEGLSEGFVAGALSGGAIGTVSPASLIDRKFDLTNKMAKDTFARVEAEGVTNPDGTPMTYDQVHAASKVIVEQTGALDNIIYPKLKKRLEEAVETESKGVPSGKHEAVERTKIEDGVVVTTKDDTYTHAPLDKTLKGETKRKGLIKQAYADLDYKAFGRSIPWSQLPELVQYNVLNHPSLNVGSANVVESLRSVLNEELDKLVVHSNPSGNTNPRATVFFGPLRNTPQNWVSGREETKQDPEIHGDIWISELPRVLKENGIDPKKIEFTGKGSAAAMKTFLSEWNSLYKDDKIILSKKTVSPFEFNKSKTKKLRDKAAKALDRAANAKNMGREKQVAFGTQEDYIKNIHEAVRDVWASIQSITKGNGVLEATVLLNKLAKGQPVTAKGLKVSGPQDLAEVFSVFRNPKLEISQIVYVREGKVVSHEALSIGSPADSTIPTSAVIKKANKLGAEYYIIHNHPSGNIQASVDDKIAQDKFSGDPNFLGQIILDHKQFSFLDLQGNVVPTNYKSEKIFFHEGKKGIKDYMDAGALANNNFKKGKVTLFLSDGVYLDSVIYLKPGENLADQIGVAMVENLASFYYLGTEDASLIPAELPKGGLGLAVKTGATDMNFVSIKDKSNLQVWERAEAQKYVSELAKLKPRKKKGMKLATAYDNKILQAIEKYGTKEEQLMAQQRLGPKPTKVREEGKIPTAMGKAKEVFQKKPVVVGDATGKGVSFKSAEELARSNIQKEQEGYVETEERREEVKTVPFKKYGNEDELGFLLEDQREMGALTEGESLIRDYSIIGMLNDVYESGLVGQSLADSIHATLESVNKAQKYKLTGKFRTTKLTPMRVTQEGRQQRPVGKQLKRRQARSSILLTGLCGTWLITITSLLVLVLSK